MGLLEWLHLESASVSSNSILVGCTYTFYLIVFALTKKSRYLLAFFFSDFLLACFMFDGLQEYQIYLTDFIVYSYVSYYAHTLKVKNACGIMCLLDLILINDALKYGVNGTHGELKTVIYQNIEYLAFSANLLIISSLLPFGRIYDSISRLLDHALRVKANSFYMLVFWYTIGKIHSIKN
jgi:hypothetical protein